MSHLTWTASAACVRLCVCPMGVWCRWGSAERLLGEDLSVKWSSSPRWVSNSHNPTGQRGGVCLAAAPHRPGFPSPAASSRSLSTPLCLSKLPPVPIYPSCHTFQKSGKKLMRLSWHYSSPQAFVCYSVVSLGSIHCILMHISFFNCICSNTCSDMTNT